MSVCPIGLLRELNEVMQFKNLAENLTYIHSWNGVDVILYAIFGMVLIWLNPIGNSEIRSG